MAITFKHIAASGLPMLSKDKLLAGLQQGDLIFVEGKSGLADKSIKFIEGNCLTHLGMVFYEVNTAQWLVLESQYNCGVRIGSLSHYLDSTSYDVAIARYPDLNYTAALDAGFKLLDAPYNFSEIAEIAAHHFLPFVKVDTEKGIEICSELVALVLAAAGSPLDPQANGNTPASVWMDRHIVGIAALAR